MPPRPHAAALSAVLTLGACATIPPQDADAIARGQLIYAKECAACHGPTGTDAGAQALGTGEVPPDLTLLSARNDGIFPHEFVRRFVLGLIEKENSDSAMPDFASVGLAHVYPEGGADGEVLEADFADLLAYLESIQQ